MQQKHISMYGFTLVELLVATLVFVSAVIGVSSFLVTSIIHQRNSLATQTVIDQSSFFAEYISRSLREIQKESGSGCLPVAGTNYELTHFNAGTGYWEGLKFIEQGTCKEIYLSAGSVVEAIYPSGETNNLASSNVLVNDLHFTIRGDALGDAIQAMAT